MSFYVAPSQQRTLRACMVCSLVQLHSKFMREGCPNCDNVLGLRGNNDAIQECTSQVFEGLVTLRDPTTSWVARWQRLDSYVPGTYAVKVTGSVSIHPDYSGGGGGGGCLLDTRTIDQDQDQRCLVGITLLLND
ncbi:transcriptional elongation protein Spt4 [Aspergillus luchuensis]|uniref:Transcription elongation factor SPT4 n=1 Tax=Aspergillus kawachii TaxID=1069201 RepID=A0A146G026_ASPKA|nr:transcriptional elongation protein Spt4 [Aspergillus luchuensis]